MSREDHRQARGLADLFLDDRLRSAHEPPGVRNAVTTKISEGLTGISDRCGEQISQLRSPSSKRIPDAYFHDEEALENALQEVGAGIRTARAVEGLLAGDVRTQEAMYAPALAPSARWATLAEASRVPRPDTRYSALAWSLTPVPWQERSDAWPPQGAIDLGITRCLPDTEPVRVAGRPYEDWVQLGLFERQRTFATKYPDAPSRQVIMTTGLEVTDTPVSADSLPLSEHPPRLWVTTCNRLEPSLTDDVAATIFEGFQGPLAAMVSYQGQVGAPGPDRGAGLHPFILSPRIEIVAYLGLRPEQPAVRHCLIDDHGPAIVGRLWRSYLIHDGNYTPLEPAVHGADLIIRPDLYARLSDTIGEDRIQSGIAVRHYAGDEHDVED